jgi:hypothetical protein
MAAAMRAALEAIDACDRLAPKLLDLMAHHEHAASVARVDWSGPHHDTFEERFSTVQRALADGSSWVLHVRHEAEAKLAALLADTEESARLLPVAGPR